MPRRSILSAAERQSLLTLPDSRDELIRRYTLSESDLSIIRQRRGAANKLGFAVQLCYLRFPGIVLGVAELPFPPLLHLVADQLKIPAERWAEYGDRAQTRREHLVELQTLFDFEPFTTGHHRLAVQELIETAMQTDKGIVLATRLVEMLRERRILLPALNAVERVCAEAITRANRRIYKQLTDGLTEAHRGRLDQLLVRKQDSSMIWLGWLRQSPLRPNSRHMLEHIQRLQTWRALNLPSGIERQIHQNRLLKIAREGGQMTSADLMKFEPDRRYATLVALAVEGTATVTDEVIELHDRIVGKLFNAARHKHQEQFQADGKAINDKLRLYGRVGQALLEAKQNGSDPFAAIENIVSWEEFATSITEAQKLAQPEDFDFLYRTEALQKAGCKKIFEDRVSGTRAERPGLSQARESLPAGDTLVVWKLDRLGRSVKHLVDLVGELQQQGIQFKILTDSIDTGTPSGRFFFHVMDSLAEMERELIVERTRAGLEVARQVGRTGGRKRQMTETKVKAAEKLLASGVPARDVASNFGVSVPTLYRWVLASTHS